MRVYKNEFPMSSKRLNEDKLDLAKTLENGADVGFESFGGKLASVNE
jgi:hypothetical protein